MSDRIYINYRNPDAWSVRSALANLSAEDLENVFEKDMLLKYQNTLRQYNQKVQEIDDTCELLGNIHAGNDNNYRTVKKGLEKTISHLASQRDTLDRNLIDLQNDPILKNVIEREKAKAIEIAEQKAEQRREESRAKAKERAEQTERELRERYQKSRQEAIQRREELQAKLKQETISEAPIEVPKSELPKEDIKAKKDKASFSLPLSKRIAAVISILLCVTLYLSFLSAFTIKRDTYICYTTKTGECFHSATCQYLNTAYETTVYEASKKYKVCKYCNPCVEQYATTITERNYVIPILISVPISGAVFLLLTYKKKK